MDKSRIFTCDTHISPGDSKLIEECSKQLTHSRDQGKTTYYNDISAYKSAEAHDRLLSVVFQQEDEEIPRTPPRKAEVSPCSPRVGNLTPTQGKQKRYFRDSDRVKILDFFKAYEISSLTSKFIYQKLTSNDAYTLKEELREGRSQYLNDKDLSSRVYSFLKNKIKKSK